MLCSALSPLSKSSLSSSSSSMASTTLIQHPRHDQHPLEPRDFSEDSIPHLCDLCYQMISADYYACKEKCKFYAHRVCAEAPHRIDLHPLHPDHPLTLIHRPPPFLCDACGTGPYITSFRCDECDFHLDLRCGLSTLYDRGGTQGKTPEQIKLPLHLHTLTSFSIRHEFIMDIPCVICKARVEGDGYACLIRQCKFLIHKRCIQDLYYTDGSKAPQIYHRHPLETFLGGNTGSSKCAKCGSDESSGEFIGCAECQVFYCRDCVQVPEIIQYPRKPDNNLILLINCPDNDRPQCGSCLVSLDCDLCYCCPTYPFFMDVGCALQVLAYCEEGMSAEIKLPWHEHPLLLCHRTKNWQQCFCCEEESAGPMYTCKEEGCEILLHKRCTEIKSTIIHPHHPDHPLTLRNKDDFESCEACGESILHLYFSCQLCAFYLHTKCAAHVPTRKHYLHQHRLLHLENGAFYVCNRCSTCTNASLFRCVTCNFNLHEKCMELPQVVKHDTHVHPLALQETYVEDDSGEYYCDLCEKRRDERLGVYVCGQCPARWAFHIECILPELRKVFVRKGKFSVVEALDQKIASIDEEVHKTGEKLKGMKRELDELLKQRAQIISREEKSYVAITGKGEPGNPS